MRTRKNSEGYHSDTEQEIDSDGDEDVFYDTGWKLKMLTCRLINFI